MTIWRRLYGSLRGGPSDDILGGMSSFVTGQDGGSRDELAVTPDAALKLGAVWACMHLRAETIGTLPLHIRDDSKKVVRDHDLYNKLHRSPNADMTAAEYWSMSTAHVDMLGNAISIIERGVGKKVIALTPADPSNASWEYNKSRSRKTWKIGKDEFHDDDILHLRGFSLNGGWGAARIDIGRQILLAQLTANKSAMTAFKQGLKVGGFLVNKGSRDLTTEQLTHLQERLSFFGQPQNAGKWMSLVRGLEPIAGQEFTVKPADAQLLESRYFGIEEICRLFNVPPQLIGQTNKASSWASSIENINLHYLTYSVMPTVIRYEQRMEKKLLTPYDIAEGLEVKFSLGGLLRGDMKTRQAFYASALQNGWMNRNEVRDLEDRGTIPGGDKYTVQTNMTAVGDLSNTDGTDKPDSDKPDDEDDDQ